MQLLALPQSACMLEALPISLYQLIKVKACPRRVTVVHNSALCIKHWLPRWLNRTCQACIMKTDCALATVHLDCVGLSAGSLGTIAYKRLINGETLADLPPFGFKIVHEYWGRGGGLTHETHTATT